MDFMKNVSKPTKKDAGVDVIVSRDGAAFAGSSIPRKTARECLEAML